MRVAIFLATVLVAGCPSGNKPESPRAGDDRALRIRIAQLEARRGAGVDELVALAQKGELLAIRALGRSGAVKPLLGMVSNRDPRISHAALDAIGLAASLDETSPLSSAVQSELAPEAFGRAGDASLMPRLVECATTNPACGIALGRMGRRKIPFTDDTRLALARIAESNYLALRYAAVYALQREHEPVAMAQVTLALLARAGVGDAETRASAISALVKRKARDAAQAAFAQSLYDRDWRVDVEAVRAAASDENSRGVLVPELSTRWSDLLKTADAMRAQPLIEALRALIGKVDAKDVGILADLAKAATNDKLLPSVTRGWIECLALAAAAQPGVVDAIAKCGLPDHLRLPLLAELINAKVGDAALRRAALRILLAHDDPRVRAAGIGALPATWKDGDAKAQATIVGTIASSMGAKNPIIAGTAVEAAPAIYDAMGKGSSLQAALDNALVARAKIETDVELAASLLELIGKRALASGADACRAGLAKHPVLAKAAAECLRALGQGVAAPALGPAQPPPVDVATVIGKKLRWHLVTTRGEIIIELRPDVAPWAVATIVELTRRGYYNGIEFHRVVPNFVVQGGDPTMSGWGGPGFTIPAEPSSSSDGPGFVQGGVGIADAGRDSGGSQWFIMHSRAPHLDGRYTWFGSVISGQNHADALLIGDRVERAEIEQL